MAQYKVLTGVEYLGKRAEAGDIVSDLPSKSIKWLRECGAIELLDPNAKDADPEPEPVEEPVAEPVAEPITEPDAIAEED